MPVVPFSAAAGGRSGAEPKAKPVDIPDADAPWVLMAAAAMDAQGRLVASGPTSKDPADVA